MIVKTKTKTTKNKDSQSQTTVQEASEDKPGIKLRKKIVNSYNEKIKPSVKKAIYEAGSDLKEMIIRK